MFLAKNMSSASTVSPIYQVSTGAPVAEDFEYPYATIVDLQPIHTAVAESVEYVMLRRGGLPVSSFTAALQAPEETPEV